MTVAYSVFNDNHRCTRGLNIFTAEYSTKRRTGDSPVASLCRRYRMEARCLKMLFGPVAVLLPWLPARASVSETGARALISGCNSIRLLLVFTLLLFGDICSGLGGTSTSFSFGSSSGSTSSYLPPHWLSWNKSIRTVQVAQGVLRGRVLSVRSPVTVSTRLRDVEVFLGVPYAAPPTGRLRFHPPQPPANWEGERELTKMPPSCIQAFPNISGGEEQLSARMSTARLNYLRKMRSVVDGSHQSEDCLYLNIYVPATLQMSESRQLPVLVVLSAGDSYSWGSGNHVDGSLTAAYSNVIVVSINYRLGVLGFLSSGSPSSFSNVGLQDQLIALRWLRTNLGAFGGDRDKVTLAGAGRAAAMAHLLAINARAADLLRRLVLVGGSALSSWAVCTDGPEQTLLLARALGCKSERTSSSLESPMECFRESPVEELVRASLTLQVPDHLCGPFGPTPDGDMVPIDVYEASHPEGRQIPFSQIDLVVGVTKWESLQLFNDYQRVHGIELSFKEKTLRTLIRNLFVYHQNEILFSVSNEYTNWSRGESSTLDILQDTADALSDSTVVAPAIEVTALHSHLTATGKIQRSTHLFVFSYQSSNCDYSHLYTCTPGAEDAFNFLLGVPLLDALPSVNYSRQDMQVSELMLNYISNFLRTGQPNSSTIETFETVTQVRPSRPVTEEISWPPYESVHGIYLLVDTKPRSLQHFEAHRMSLWNRLIPALHRPDIVDSNGTLVMVGDDELDISENRKGNNDASEGLTFPRGYPLSQSPFVFRLPSLVTLQSTSQPQQSIQPRRVAFDPALMAPVSSPMPPSESPSGNSATVSTPLDQIMLSLESLASGPYSKALFITIAVGCSLLVVNILVFAGTYYQHRTESDHHQKNRKTQHREGIRNVEHKMPATCAGHDSPMMFHLQLTEKASQKSNGNYNHVEFTNDEVQLGIINLYNLGEGHQLLAELTDVTASPLQEDTGPENEQLMRPLLGNFNIRQADATSEARGNINAMSAYKEPDYQNIAETNQR
ncbi:neuroligin-4, X-linked-like isoform X3 [Varroa destructor]|nr:neuroligin-4, X-linked-like isoform X3 [Varroa destructor]